MKGVFKLMEKIAYERSRDVSPFGLRKYGNSVIAHKPRDVGLFAERKYGIIEVHKRRSGVVIRAILGKKNSLND